MVLPATVPTASAPASAPLKEFSRRAGLFLLIGVVIYTGCYAAAEALVYRYAHSNRFYAVRATPPTRFDYVILGASHAAVFDYRDMNRRLEELTSAKIMNLAVVGGGVTVNRLLFDYFLTRHRTSAIVYVVDSFAFYSAEWNERRLQDRRLFVRAPFDPSLAVLLLGRPATRSVAADYITGFSKINNRDRFVPDRVPEAGARFDRRYRPVPQIDRERLAYLYPAARVEPGTFQKYLGELDALISEAERRGMAFIAIKPPIPDRVARMIPGEAEFDGALAAIVERRRIEFHDFSHVGNDEALFQDTDHLNRTGVLKFFESSLAPVLARKLPAVAAPEGIAPKKADTR